MQKIPFQPDCSRHAGIVSSHARGMTDAQTAAQVESVLRDCPACSQWWRSLEAEHEVAVAVAEGLASTPLVRARGRRALTAVAAGALLALATGALWQVVSVPQHTTMAGPDDSRTLTSHVESQSAESSLVFADGMDNGEIGASWVIHQGQ